MTSATHLRAKYKIQYSYVLPKLISTEVFPMRRFISKDRQKQVVFDVGANHGIWAKAWIDINGDKLGTLHMFEPLSGNRALIKERLDDGFITEIYPEAIDNIVINPVAVGNEPGTAVINFENETSGLASLCQETSIMPGREVPLARHESVKVVSIDEYCKNNEIEYIDILKIDVEGFELNVLQGADRMFSENKVGAVCYEFGLHQLAQRHRFLDFWEFFSQRNYSMSEFGLGKRGWDLTPMPKYQGRYEDFSTITMHCGYSNTFA